MHVGHQLHARPCAQHGAADSRLPKAPAQEDVDPACRHQERPLKDTGPRVQGAGDRGPEDRGDHWQRAAQKEYKSL